MVLWNRYIFFIMAMVLWNRYIFVLSVFWNRYIFLMMVLWNRYGLWQWSWERDMYFCWWSGETGIFSLDYGLVKQVHYCCDDLVKQVYFLYYGNGLVKQVHFCLECLLKQVHFLYDGPVKQQRFCGHDLWNRFIFFMMVSWNMYIFLAMD